MRYKVAICLSLVCLNTQANMIQYFTGITYSNPSELFTIKKNELVIGGTGFHTVGRFQGTVLNFNNGQYGQGTSYTRTTSFLPYGRIATRLNEKTVFAVDVTEPFHSNLNWGNNSFTRYAATQTYLTDVEVSPRFSYGINQKFYVGGGLNFNFLKNNETNWALPVSQTMSANLVNRTSGFGLGYNIGGYYLVNQSNFLGLVYYSKIRQDTHGTSQLQDITNTKLGFDFNMPATTVLSYVHLFNPSWLANVKVYLSEWDANQYAAFHNTSAQPPLSPDFTFTMKFRKSLAFVGAVRHQCTQTLGLTAIGMIDHGPERDQYRTINFPADKQYFLGLVGDYHFTEQTSVELLYGYGFSNTMMNNHVSINNQSLPFTTGRVKLYANVVDLKVKVQV